MQEGVFNKLPDIFIYNSVSRWALNISEHKKKENGGKGLLIKVATDISI